METNLQDLLEEIKQLEKSVVEQLKKKEDDLVFKIKNRTVLFEKEIIMQHRRFRKSIRRFLWETSLLSYLVAPVIYSMIIPAVILDIFASFYQFVCFPVYGLSLVVRKDYISLDRRRLSYLNLIEKINCDYCGYFNGVIAYVREIGAKTEQYFCPIRHALRTKGLHPRHAQFLPFGEADAFQEKFVHLRDDVRKSRTGI